MEILGHKINYNLYIKYNLTKKDLKKIFSDIYEKHVNFGYIYGKNKKVIGTWSYDM